jgi:hypothetical protein
MLDTLQKHLQPDTRLEITVWDPENENSEHHFTSFIEAVGGLNIRIAGPGPSKSLKITPLLAPGLVIGILLDANPSPFLFYPVVQSRTDDGESYWLQIPPSAEVQRLKLRGHVRITMVVPFEVEYALANSLIRMKARTEDLSGGGLKFSSSKKFLKDQILRLRIQLNPELPELSLSGKVVYSSENQRPRYTDDLFVTACQFVNLTPVDENIIMRECFRRELGMKQS